MVGKRKSPPRQPAGRTDWKRVGGYSDAEIERMAARDTDNPRTKKHDWANAVVGMAPLKVPVNAELDATWWSGTSHRAAATRHARTPCCGTTCKSTVKSAE